MTAQQQQLIQKAYAGFNAREIASVLSTFHPQVQWSKAWEGSYATGHQQVADYWTRQWKEIDPHVEPVAMVQNDADQIEVTVHQTVRNMQGQVVFDGMVKHIYTLQDGLIVKMDVAQ